MIKRHLSNIIGPTTNRHLLAFFVDDYGAVNTASRQALERMERRGYPIGKSRFVRYDTLEDNEDIEVLFNVLTSIKDINGRNVVWTPLAVPVNPDFEKIKESNYMCYHYETLDRTLSRLEGYDKVYDYIKKGIADGFFCPQFHGREHINVRLWMEALRAGWKDAVIPFENNSLCVFKTQDGASGSNMAFRYRDSAELESYKDIIKDGLHCFEQVFGYHAIHFNAPGERESTLMNETLFDNGIRFIETDKIKNEPLGDGKFKRVIRWNGQKNSLGQRYVIRNCVFEPTDLSSREWVDYTMKQIEIAFLWKKPAVVSAHRVNFAGRISSKNRDTGIQALTQLLKKVKLRFPDVEFVSSKELFEIMFK